MIIRQRAVSLHFRLFKRIHSFTDIIFTKMKIIYTFLFLFLSIVVQAQSDYVLTLKGDTVYGTITIVPDKLYDKIISKNEDGKQEFKAYQISTVRINDEFYDPITYLNRKVMGLRVIRGPLSLYKIRPENEYEFYKELLVKENQETSEVPMIGFKRVMLNFLPACEELQQKINDKEFVKNDIEKIVAFYNSSCQGLKKPVKKLVKAAKPNSSLPDLATLVLDIQNKKQAGEEIPSYMVKALQAYQNEDLNKLINLFLSDNE